MTVAQPNAADKLSLASYQVPTLASRVVGRKPPAHWSPYYTLDSRLIENAALRALDDESLDVIFYESVEKYFSRLRRDGKKRFKGRVVGMVHQPPGWWRLNNPPRNLLEPFDLLFALSEQSRAHLVDEMGARNVVLLQHGVDAHFFSPPPDRVLTGRPQILVMGDWLRDFELTAKVIEQTHARYDWHLVIPKTSRTTDRHYIAARYDSVRWYNNISDDALLALYRTCHAMFLPLIDATANNAVLEALAAGLPLMVTGVGGVEEYTGPHATFIADRDTARSVATLDACLADYPTAVRKAEEGVARVRSLLSWDVTGPKIADAISSA